MTALKEYDRLEASGLWRARPEDQRKEVIVSIGEATLTISDMRDQPLTHWSLAALDRVNPGELPAIYSPVGEASETLEIAEDETNMIAAIEKLRLAVDRSRSHPGRLRFVGVLTVLVVALSLAVFWLPGALRNHTASVVPDIRRDDIGRELLTRIERVAGRACNTTDGTAVLSTLARRTGVQDLIVLRAGVADSQHLPGGIVLLNKALIEDHEDPSVVAGYILAERTRAERSDPLAEVLSSGGPTASFRLLTTGRLTRETLDAYAEQILVKSREKIPDDALLRAFAESSIASTPYAYAVDVTGETVLSLIEADPMSGRSPQPVLPDRDWVMLQNICGG